MWAKVPSEENRFPREDPAPEAADKRIEPGHFIHRSAELGDNLAWSSDILPRSEEKGGPELE